MTSRINISLPSPIFFSLVSLKMLSKLRYVPFSFHFLGLYLRKKPLILFSLLVLVIPLVSALVHIQTPADIISEGTGTITWTADSTNPDPTVTYVSQTITPFLLSHGVLATLRSSWSAQFSTLSSPLTTIFS